MSFFKKSPGGSRRAGRTPVSTWRGLQTWDAGTCLPPHVSLLGRLCHARLCREGGLFKDPLLPILKRWIFASRLLGCVSGRRNAV